MFFTTIAAQLAQKPPALKRCIVEVVNENRDIDTRSMSEQWELLILGTLAMTKSELPHFPLLLVIDALDECDDQRDVRLIIDLLASVSKHKLNNQLRVLVTSKPETPIRLGFGENAGIWHRDVGLGEISRGIIDDDLTLYFWEEFKNTQLDANIIRRLVEKACGLFIWAATACRFFKQDKHPALFARKRLSLVLEGGTSERNPEKELDHIYAQILSNSIVEEYEEERGGVIRAFQTSCWIYCHSFQSPIRRRSWLPTRQVSYWNKAGANGCRGDVEPSSLRLGGSQKQCKSYPPTPPFLPRFPPC